MELLVDSRDGVPVRVQQRLRVVGPRRQVAAQQRGHAVQQRNVARAAAQTLPRRLQEALQDVVDLAAATTDHRHEVCIC